eukprot:Clim_evm48s246 gene=Clim_evmTU48s246
MVQDLHCGESLSEASEVDAHEVESTTLSLSSSVNSAHQVWITPEAAVRDVLNEQVDFDRSHRVAANYMSKHGITHAFREDLLQWVHDIVVHYEKDYEVYCRAVRLFDRFLDAVCSLGSRPKLQLIMTACLLQASKMYEQTPMEVSFLCSMADNSFTVEDVVAWEQLVSTTLEWDLDDATHLFFAREAISITVRLFGEQLCQNNYMNIKQLRTDLDRKCSARAAYLTSVESVSTENCAALGFGVALSSIQLLDIDDNFLELIAQTVCYTVDDPAIMELAHQWMDYFPPQESTMGA